MAAEDRHGARAVVKSLYSFPQVAGKDWPWNSILKS